MIPTTEELKGVCVKEMNENHSDKLQCDVQKLLKANGHTWLWTPPSSYIKVDKGFILSS